MFHFENIKWAHQILKNKHLFGPKVFMDITPEILYVQTTHFLILRFSGH